MSFMNALQASLPIFYLSHYYSASFLAFYFLILKLIASPLGVLSNAVFSVSARDIADNKSDSKKMTKTLLISFYWLSFIAFCSGAFIVLIVISFDIFFLLTGNILASQPYLIIALLPSILIKFIISPLTSCIPATNNIHLEAVWKLPAFFITFGVLHFISGEVSEIKFLIILSITDILLYAFYLLLCFIAVRKPKSDLGREKSLSDAIVRAIRF